MTRELFWLTLTVILTGVMWIPYVLNRCQIRGLTGAMANPSRNDKPHAEWANRMMFAHDNAVENLIIFAPLVLILAQIDYSTKWTVLACAVYFWSRVAHLIVYTIGLPVFRTLAFTVGFFAQAVLVLAIFKIVRHPSAGLIRPPRLRRIAGRNARALARRVLALPAADPLLSSHGNSAICSSPAVSGSPNIRFMFWIACPAEPFTRLSSTEMTMARFLMRSANTPICT